MPRLYVLALCLSLVAQTRFAGAVSETEEVVERSELDSTPTPPPVKKALPVQNGPQIDVGTIKPGAPRPTTGSTLGLPPVRLSVPKRPVSASQPTSDFLVAIDVGHTKTNGGAISAHGVFEYTFNRRLAGELLDFLQAAGRFHSLMINPNGGEIGLVRRAMIANERQANLFLAIHHDSVKDRFLKDWAVGDTTQKYCDDFHGYSVFFSRKNVAAGASERFARLLGTSMKEAGLTPTLHHVAQEHRPIVDPTTGVYAFDDLLVLKNAKMPAALLECGVIVNRDEEKELNTLAYREKIIRAINRAIGQFADSEVTPGKPR